MAIYLDTFDDTVVRLIEGGGIGIIRTDTLYGIVARADNEAAVSRVFSVKQRTPTKPPISLISSTEQLFDIYDQSMLNQLKAFWPGKNTVILPATRAPEWLMRGTRSVSYRLPDNPLLLKLIEKTGPLIAPSANPEGMPPAMTIEQAKDYFGDRVDFYVDGGRVEDDSPSKIYRQASEGFERLR